MRKTLTPALVVLGLMAPAAEARVYIDTDIPFKLTVADNLPLCTLEQSGAVGDDHGPTILLDPNDRGKCNDSQRLRNVDFFVAWSNLATLSLDGFARASNCDPTVQQTGCTPMAGAGLAIGTLQSRTFRVVAPKGEVRIVVLAVAKPDRLVSASLHTSTANLQRDMDAFRALLKTVQILPADAACNSSEPWPWYEKRFVSVHKGCTVEALSPDGKLVLRVAKDGGVSVRERATKTALTVKPERIGLGASLMWSPRSDAFFVGHAGLPGKGTVFRVYKRQGSVFADDAAFDAAARRLYGTKNPCGRVARDPDVWPLGWSPDGKTLDLYAEAQEKGSCKIANAYTAVEMGLADRGLQHSFTPAEIRKEFPWLP